MSIKSVINDTASSESFINAQKPLPPTISSYSVGGLDDTALDPAGGQTVQISGTGFLAGATITFDGNAVAVVTYVNPNQLTFTSPAKSAGTYTIYVVNPDGGTAIYIPGIIYSVLPTWTTSAGSLGSYYETTSISNTVVASGDAPITYSLYSGSLPTGSTLAANGVITGTAPVDSSSTTYSFTIEAIDAQLQSSTRSFSLTINTDVVTWVSPANGTTYTSAVDSAIANVTLSATDAAGYAVSYSANALPTGLSLIGANISGTPTVIADSSTLLTATAATTNRSATRTINWSITVANDPYFEYNTLLIPGASTTFVDDASTNNFAVTINGDTKPNSFNPYTPGYYSAYFDGSGDFLGFPSSYLPTVAGTEFTLEFWIYPTRAFSSATTIISSGNIELNIVSPNGQIRFDLPTGQVNVLNSGSSYPTLNAWNHVVLTRTTGNNYTLYLNGISVGTGSSSTAITTLSTFGYNASTPLQGYISQLRVTSTVVYSSNFTPPTSPLTAISGTTLLTCQSNRFIDNSTNAYAITVYGDTKIQSFTPFTPNSNYATYGSGYFDGTGDYLTVATNSAFNFGTGDFTIEAWVNPASLSTFFISSSTGSGGFFFGYNDFTGGYGWGRTAVAWDYQPVTTASINAWQHVAVSRSGTSMRLFVNGIQQGTTQTNSTSYDLSVTSTTIGSQGSTYYLNGYLSNIRIVKGTAVYTTTFTPPSAPLTAIANTSLLTLQNNQSVNNNVFLDNSTNNFLVTRNGNTTQGTFSPYGGNWSNYFDGSGDYLSIANNSAFNQNSAFTIECWVNSSAGGFFFTQLNSGYLCLNYDSSTKKIVVDRSYIGVAITSTNSFPFNQWHHVAMSYDGTTTRLFVNGALEGSVAGGGSASGTDTRIGNYNTGSNFYTGYISNFRVSNTGLYTSAFTPSTTPLTPTANTKFLSCQSNSLVDNSINNLTITKGGDTSVQRFSPFNPSSVTPTSYSGYFDGSGDNLTVASNVAFQLGTGDYTFECWFNPASIASPGINTLLNIGTYITGLFFRCGSGIEVYTNNVQRLAISSTGILSANTWQHAALVRSGSACAVYINGTSVGTFTDSSSISPSTATVMLGMSAHDSGETFTGYMSNARLVKGTAVYTSNFTPPTTPLTAISGTSLLTCQSTTFIDNSTNNFTITVAGNTKPTQQNPFGFTSTTTNGYTPSTIGGSGYFDGSGDYLSIPNNTNFGTLSGDFTIECWFYPTAATMGAGTLFTCRNFSIVQYVPYIVWIESTTITVYMSSNGGSWNIISGGNAGTMKPFQWQHFALVRSGSAIKTYLNGVVQSAAGTFSGTLTNTAPFNIGASPNDTNPFFYGYITDTRLVNGTALYTNNFVPPLAPLTAIRNTSLLTNMTSAGIYDASMMNNFETVGDAKLSTAITKFGGSSMYFDGTGDWLYGPKTWRIAAGANFTIEGWFYLTAAQADYRMIVSDGSGQGYISLRSYGIEAQFLNTTATIANGDYSFAQNTWYHIALVRNNNSVVFYINGTAAPMTNPTQSGSFLAQGNVLYVGRFTSSTDYPRYGYIDDLRITNGVARYTSNFTSPTAPFQLY